MDSPREWDRLFEEAALEYKATAASKVVTVDSGRVWSYIKKHPDKYPQIIEYVERDEFAIIAVKQRINAAIRRQGIKGIWFMGSGFTLSNRTGGNLYVNAVGKKEGVV